jgi:hypothetical protein
VNGDEPPPEWVGHALFCIAWLIVVALAMLGLVVN